MVAVIGGSPGCLPRIPHSVRVALVLLVLIACSPFLASRTEAACTTTLGAMNFGIVDLLANTAVSTNVTASVSCTGFAGVQTVLVCIGIGWGSDGGDHSNGRYLETAAGTYQITEVSYQNSGLTTIWGAPWDVSSNTVAKQLVLTTNSSGAVSTSFTAYGRIGPGYTDAPPGTYTTDTIQSRTVSHVRAGTGDNCSGTPMANWAGATPSYATSGTISATVNAACSLSTGTLSFGTTGSVIAANRDASTTITAECTSTTPYSVGFNNGSNASGSQNRMRLGATANYVTYELYTDSARLNPWSTTTSAGSCSGGANTCALGTGNGSNQTITIYGRVPPQNVPVVGTFTDTVVMTVTY